MNARSSLCGAYELILGMQELAEHPWLASVVQKANNRALKQSCYEEIWDATFMVEYC